MRKDGVVRYLRRGRRTLVAGVMLIVSLAGLGVVSPVLAKQPTGDFAVFKQCPRFTTGVNLCLYSQITGGVTTLGKLTVPIVNPVTLQVGIIFTEPKTATEFETETFVAALNEETLSPTPQPVPGGLSSVIDCNEIKDKGFWGRLRRGACRAILNNHWYTAVNETTELAGPTSQIHVSKRNEEIEEGVGLTLPVKIHLENPLLGNDCYIGSNTNPIIYNLTTGTTIANLGITEVKFPHPVFEGDTLHATTEVLGKRASKSRPGAGIVELHHRCYNQDDRLVAECRRSAFIHMRPA